MDSNLVGKGARAEKMLSMIGIRLEKVEQHGQGPHWKVCSFSGVSNPQLDTNKPDCDVFAEQHNKPTSNGTNEVKDGVSNKKEQDTIPSANDDMDLNIQSGQNTILNDNKENMDPAAQYFKPNDNTKLDDRNETLLSRDSSDGEEPFSSDDSVQDPNYANDSSSSSSSSDSSDDIEVEMANTVNLPIEPDIIKKRTRQRKAVPSQWKKFTTKRLRNTGKAYKTLGKGLAVSERQMKPPCNDSKCTQKMQHQIHRRGKVGPI